jgi:hypothetical protein
VTDSPTNIYEEVAELKGRFNEFCQESRRSDDLLNDRLDSIEHAVSGTNDSLVGLLKHYSKEETKRLNILLVKIAAIITSVEAVVGTVLYYLV